MRHAFHHYALFFATFRCLPIDFSLLLPPAITCAASARDGARYAQRHCAGSYGSDRRLFAACLFSATLMLPLPSMPDAAFAADVFAAVTLLPRAMMLLFSPPDAATPIADAHALCACDGVKRAACVMPHACQMRRCYAGDVAALPP